MTPTYKKNKNFFQQPILHESLFHEDVVKISKIGGMTVEPGWLKNTTPYVYYIHVKSAIYLAELQNNKLNL